MNKVDLVRSAMERVELKKNEAVLLVDGIFDDIVGACVGGEPVKIPGFGQFKVRDRAARIARNPATGQPVKVPAKRVFKFLPAKALKEAVMSKRRAKAAPARKKATTKRTMPKAVPRKAIKKTARRKR